MACLSRNLVSRIFPMNSLLIGSMSYVGAEAASARNAAASFAGAAAASFATSAAKPAAVSSSLAAKELVGHEIVFQPDYTLGSQFAGVAIAWAEGIYAARGLDVTILPPCPGRPGDEVSAVEKIQREAGNKILAIGTTEQNVLIAAQSNGAKVKAVSAMLQRTPLALGAMPGVKLERLEDLKGLRVGMARDEMPLLEGMAAAAGLHGLNIVEVTHEGKQQELLAAKVDAIQIYDTTEVVDLHKKIGQLPVVLPIGQQPYDRGYAQVVFASNSALANEELRTPMRNFLEATYEGWARAAADPEAAAEAVAMMTAEDPTPEVLAYHRDVLLRFLPYLEPPRPASGAPSLSASSSLGTIQPSRWLNAVDNYVGAGLAAPHFREAVAASADLSFWAPARLFPTPGGTGGCVSVDGMAVASSIRAEAAASAAMAERLFGRKPRLAVLRFGTMDAVEAFRRAEIRSKQATSWYCMDVAGEAVGVDVQLHRLDATAGQEDALAAVAELNGLPDVDAIMVEMPLPEGVTYDALVEAVDPEKRVDALEREMLGGLMFPAPTGDAVVAAPVSPTACLELLRRAGVQLRGRKVALVGRGRLVGAPLAQILLARGATVSVCAASTPAASLRELCAAADIVISAAGVPGLITQEHVRPGAVVVNVGTTFDEARSILLPDVASDVAQRASLLVGCPGGVGPIPVAVLLRAVAASAHRRGQAAAPNGSKA
mmetsp:Transcript_11523/g.29070  ORF Transcript_11523/g.29070 Transcript_11523/m.29070 type:complete len:715 (-) Transcript_11523:23-2167(-)